jgi:plastocyanin
VAGRGEIGVRRRKELLNASVRRTMADNMTQWRAPRPAALVCAAAVLLALGTLVGAAVPQYTISQKGREFHPGDITIKRGDTVVVVNDDGDLLHHVYVESAKFSFDSGDQEPGSRASISFAAAGDFDVLCAIHPKMRLAVHVQ